MTILHLPFLLLVLFYIYCTEVLIGIFQSETLCSKNVIGDYAAGLKRTSGACFKRHMGQHIKVIMSPQRVLYCTICATELHNNIYTKPDLTTYE